ncbi:hypothetical protein [Parachryseolinea silvisoli]|uniref:hypothetical protein n=1 Tax=Parachryseolinea silvisoli TaxID=2873601 RepID=UPI002265A34F|nr:hypothetical protein [Parachryseolinea silvisoli]MCD9018208.1 hypothetical protein [Parachryseolinea silvisoli]
MTAKKRLEENSIWRWLFVILFLFLSLKSRKAQCETLKFHTQEYGHAAEGRHPLADTVGVKSDKPLYLGYEFVLGTSVYTLKSDLSKLNRLRVTNLGVAVGGVLANKFGKIRGSAGLYYSDPSLSYSFDLFTGALSTNVYLLRMGKARYHTVEPYFLGGISQQHIKFYGNLDRNSTRNHSKSEEQFLGKEVTTQFNLGLGAEYQLENDQGDFIHLFAEVAWGVPVATRCTRQIFDRTHIINPVNISIGINFGKTKQRSK